MRVNTYSPRVDIMAGQFFSFYYNYCLLDHLGDINKQSTTWGKKSLKYSFPDDKTPFNDF